MQHPTEPLAARDATTGWRCRRQRQDPAIVDGAGRHASVASAESHSVTSPRWTKACSYADHFPTRYFVLYFGWTVDLMSRSCTRSGHRGQRAYSCLVAAEGLCTNAPQRRRA